METGKVLRWSVRRPGAGQTRSETAKLYRGMQVSEIRTASEGWKGHMELRKRLPTKFTGGYTTT